MRTDRKNIPSSAGKIRSEIFHNQRIKEFPGFIEVMTCSRPLFREPGWEFHDKWEKEKRERKKEPGSAPDPEDIARAVRRAKINLRDLALCNEMSHFVTLTIDQTKIDRFDMEAIVKKMNIWCSNHVQRDGLSYILVPELHKDGAIHFHGFINGALQLDDSGTISLPNCKKPKRPRSEVQRSEWLRSGGHIVYNIRDWTFGFSTAIELYGDPFSAVMYCCKYIGKQKEGEIPQKIGGRWFYHGGCRNRPAVTYADVDFDQLALQGHVYAWEVPAAGAIFTKERINL